MASSIQLLRSTIAQERPFPGNLLEGQPAVNLNASEPGLFFKAADGSLVKFGPAAITSDGSPPNSSSQGSAGNTIGELWLDKSTDPAVLKVYDGTNWINAGSGGGGGGGTGSFVRWIYTAIGGETSLSGSSGGVLLDYTPGLEEVFINGVLITRGTDYSAINGSSITNLTALTAGDVVTVTSMNPLETVQLPGQVTLLRWTVLATSGQTVLSGIDSSSQQLAYSAGYEEVYVNGSFLRRGLDYTATNGSSITLASPLALDDEVTVMAWSEIQIGDLDVNTDDLADGAVTDAKVNTNAGITSNKLSFSRAETDAVVRTVQSKLRDVYSVLDFGADPTGTSDSHAAITAAIEAGKGGKILLPAGTYRVSQPVEMKYSDTELIGNGTGQTGDGGTHLTTTISGFSGSGVIDVTGGRLQKISGMYVHAGFTGADCIRITSGQLLSLSDLILKGAAGGGGADRAGVRLVSGNSQRWYNILTESCNYGFVIDPDAGDNTNGCFGAGLRAYNNGVWGFDVRPGAGSSGHMHSTWDVSAEAGQGGGVRVNGGRYCDYTLYSEGHDGDEFDLDPNAANYYFVKNANNEVTDKVGLFSGVAKGVYTAGANMWIDNGPSLERVSDQDFNFSKNLAVQAGYVNVTNSSGSTRGMLLDNIAIQRIGTKVVAFKRDNTPGFILSAPSTGINLVGDTGTFGAFPVSCMVLEVIKIANDTLFLRQYGS